MKNIITALMCMLLSVFSYGQCTHTFNMADSWGDGWNGYAADILVNGEVVVEGATLTDGASGTAEFTAAAGDIIELSWTSGSFASEVSWTITDGEENVIASGGTTDTDGGVASCGAEEPSGCTHTFNMADSWGDGWNGYAADILVNGEVVVEGATLTDGASGTAEFTAAAGDIIELSWTSGSFASEVSWTITDGEENVIASGGTTDTDGGVASCGAEEPSGCTHTFNMADSWGDGWNGYAADILVNGEVVVEGATLTDGASGTAEFTAAAGDIIELSWTSGSFASEVSWTITDGEENVIASGGTTDTDGGVASCGAEEPSGCTHTFNMADSWGDGWNGYAADILVNGEVVVEGATLTDGASGTAEFTAAAGDIIELSWTSGSFASEVSWTITDGEENVIASGGTTDTDGGVASCGAEEPSGCTHTFNMADSWGDGWNGYAADILVNGEVVVEGATLTDGASGTAEFTAAAGDIIELSWTSGSFASEVSWTITDGEENVIASGGTTDTDGGVASCGAEEPSGCTHTFNMADSWGDGWNGYAADILVNGEVVVEGATLTDGASGTAEFTAAAGDIIELSWTSGSFASEVSWTITDGEENVIASGGTTDTDGGVASCGTDEEPAAGCTHTFNMADSWGDGWNGYAADILVNGEVVVEGATITDGDSGSLTFEAATGDTIELSWTSGSFASEVSWTITDGEENVIASGGTTDTSAGTAYCPPPPSCLHTFNMFDSFGDGWNGYAADILVNGEVVVEGATITDGDSGSLTFEAATGDTIELSWTSGSWASEITWTMNDGGGTEIASGNTTTTNAGEANCPDCLPPTEITVSDITTEGANISWTAADDISAWEYQVVLSGEDPAETGDQTTLNPINLTGYNSNTAYDVYVRSDCGGTYSTWVVVTFTTNPACGDIITDTGGTDGNYGNNELITLTVFPEITGDVVSFDFLSFDVTAFSWGGDNLTVYNGPDTSSEVIGTYSGTNLPDTAISTHSSGALTFTFESDGFTTGAGYEILASCAPPPSCYQPTGLNISNIGGSVADFGWDVISGNESWEYIVVPTGETIPSDGYSTTAVNSTTLTDLEFLTTYDVYVRAYCGEEDGYSEWSGPVTFTTTQQTDYTIDCSLGQPVNIEYCYTNNDTTFWLFTSTDGFPLEITFNAGTIEGFWDDLTIYDGPDNTSPVLFNNNDADIEDFTDLVVESTSTAVYIEVDSDGSGSCESSFGYTPWDFEVRCKTCITQTIDFAIVGSCEPIQEFYVEANILDMGSAMNLELTDNQGSTAQAATATSVVTFGPYAANTQVVISVLNTDDTSCLVESDPLTFLCPPPPNECSIVYAGEDTTFCSDNDPATVLTASYHIAGQDTTSYDITALDECPMPINDGGTPTSVETDDIWSDVIDIGFDFCFFGDTYSQILIGSNGVLSFELDNAGGGNGWDLQGFGSSTPDQLPNSSNTTLTEANIFGVGHDINPGVCGEINYMVLGTAPARQFVVNFTEVCHFGFACSDFKSTSQIILYESSNYIDINIIDKPVCTEWNDGLAVVGIQNVDDTIAFTPEERNTGVWEATNESWRFSPSVGEADFVFEWYDGDTVIGTEETITVYPEETTTYTAAVTYNLCNGETATVTDTVLVEITPTPIPVAVEDNIFICDGEEVTLEVNVDASALSPDVVYYWTYEDVDIQFGTDNTFVFEEGSDQFGDYLVTAFNELTGCFASTIITVSEGTLPELEDGTSFNKCANGEVELTVNIANDIDMMETYSYAWYINNELMAEDTSGSFIHGEDLSEGPVVVVVTNLTSSCAAETVIDVNYYQNQNCVDMPQGISPNGDGYNDCLILDHLEDQEDIVKAEIYNRYGVKVFELNDYVDHWCGEDASGGSSGELLPVGTYFYVIQYASGREPTISWIYLNY